MSAIIVFVLFVFQMLLILTFGVTVQKIIRFEPSSLIISWIVGVFNMFALFGIIAIIVTLCQAPLSLLTTVWMIICFGVLVYVLFFERKLFKKMILKSIEDAKKQWIFLAFIAAIVLVQMWVIFVYVDSSPDGSYYIGSVTTNVYTNTLGKYDPLTGSLLTELNSRYLFANYQNYNSVIAQFFHIHPLIQAKLIMPEIIIVLVNMVYYCIGMSIFNSDRKKASFFLMFMLIFNWFSNTLYNSSNFLFTRTYEGKAILGNLVIMGMIYCFINIWNGSKEIIYNEILLGISLSSFVFSSSAMVIVPVGMTAGYLTWIIKERQYNDFKWYLGFVLPNVIVAVIYLLSSKGIIRFIIR